MTRKVIDCREASTESPCSVMISGEEEDVVKVAMDHAVSQHGYPRTAETEREIRSMLKDEVPSQQMPPGRPPEHVRPRH